MKELIKTIKQDLPTHMKTPLGFLLGCKFNQPFKFLLIIRLGIYCHKSSSIVLRFFARKLRNRLFYKYSCDVSFNIELGKNVRFGHPIGIVIGNQTKIGDNVKIWQHVTFGSHGKIGHPKSYPHIEENVSIFAGAKIIGGITIGRGSIIGANAVVSKDLPKYSKVMGNTGKIITSDNS